MMLYNKTELNKLAKELGFVRDTFEKLCRLADILAYFESDSLLSNNLALKGGTAINVAFFDLPRLSVDIDMDYSSDIDVEYSKEASKNRMLSDRVKINEHIKKYMTAQGYTLSEKSKNYHALNSLVFEYINAGGVKDNLKIEINYMNRSHVLPLSKQKINLPWSEKEISVLCVDPIEIFATKTVALLNRSAPRDLFDMYNMVKTNQVDKSEEQIYKKCVIFYSAVASEKVPEQFVFDNIGNINFQRIKTQLWPVLRHGEGFDLENAQRLITDYLKEVLIPNEQELAFWAAFSRGDYKPELLFADPDILSRINNHPMALWKCANNKISASVKQISAEPEKDADLGEHDDI